MVFLDRTEAGRLLAQKLKIYKNAKAKVYGLPRGGVIVGAEIAKELNLPLDVVIARKIGHPLQPEFGIAAVSENGHLVKEEKYAATVDEGWFKVQVEKEQTEARRRKNIYQPWIRKIPDEGKIAIIVDDGIATGLTTKAAILDIKDRKPQKIILAVPVAPFDIAEKIIPLVDEFIALKIDKDFLGAVGAYYEKFPQATDEEVIKILRKVNNI